MYVKDSIQIGSYKITCEDADLSTGDILINTVPNPDIHEYHVRKELSKKLVIPLRRNPDKRDIEDAPIIVPLYEIEGIASLGVGGYEVYIEKGKQFSWEEIDLQVLEVLEEFIKD